MLQVGIERLGKRYAAALFQLALEFNKEDRIYNQLKELSQLFSENKDIKFFFKTPFIEPYEKAKLIKRAFKGKVDELLLRFLLLLARKNRVIFLDSIARQYEKIYFKHKGIKDVDVIVPTELDDRAINVIAEAIKKHFNAKEVVVKQKVEESIIGGVIIRSEEGQIDLSVRKQLQIARQTTQKIISKLIS
ncbi:MAG: ATP synthase F1 subunit delta [Chlorobi bacterium]|nr:ATP synthase F1 subunit delta [Chlorobiota bacterium]